MGVGGGVAAYKTCVLVSRMVQEGGVVDVVLTGAARRFVGVKTFEALTARPVYTSLWRGSGAERQHHLSLPGEAEIIVVAPATANRLGLLAGGLAPDLLSTILLAAACPVLLAPAMNPRMWSNPFVQDNVRRLRERGYHFVGPEEGWLSCREVGVGRMAEPEQILAAVKEILAGGGS